MPIVIKKDGKEIQDSLDTSKGKPFVPRLYNSDKPEPGNKYYITKSKGGYSDAIVGRPTDKDTNVLSNCVGYAYGRFNEIGQYGECRYLRPVNAENFMDYRDNLPIGKDPKLGACMVWQKGTPSSIDGVGHVAIVEKIISNDEIITSESSWNGTAFFTTNRKRGDGNWGKFPPTKFLGFIYNPAVDADDYVVESPEGEHASILSGTSFSTRKITFADLGIDEEKLAPFIVTVDPNYIDIDYNALKEMKVSGMMFFAGQKYEDGSHLPREVFRAKNLRKQVEDCQRAGLLFALYTKVLARSVDEAKEELRQLYYTISRYPPGMGLWLSLKFKVGQSKEMNEKILDTYYEKLTEYGLMNGSGLYVTKDELKQIDWDKYKDKFQLWLKEYCDTVEEANSVDTLIEPDFFKFSSEEE